MVKKKKKKVSKKTKAKQEREERKKVATAFVQKTHGLPSINDILKSGITTNHTIGNIRNTNRTNRKKAYRELLTPLVPSKEEILETLLQDINIRKTKKRISIKLTFYDW